MQAVSINMRFDGLAFGDVINTEILLFHQKLIINVPQSVLTDTILFYRMFMFATEFKCELRTILR